MKTLGEVLKQATDYLQQHNIKRSKYEAECLLADLLHSNRLNLYLEFDRPLTDLELDLCRERLKRRAKGEPLQYIKEEVEFHGLLLKVTPDVLIPRQETEILVDLIAKKIQTLDLKGKILWDICSGSGCIGLSLKKLFPDLQVILSDISPKALLVAQENAKRNAIDVTFLQGDLFSPFAGKKAHFLVCNPPYISEKEFEILDHGVKVYEPKLALVAGSSGLEFYHRIAEHLEEFLFPEASAWFEIGYSQGDAVQRIFQAKGFNSCTIKKDYAGHDRFCLLDHYREPLDLNIG